MGKKRRISHEGTFLQAPSLRLSSVQEQDKVVKDCIVSLNKQYRQGLGFTSAPRSAKVTRYSVTSPYQHFGIARETYRIFPICRTVDASYWAGITIDFQFLDPSHHLVDAAIIIFQGEFTESKVPILRAEWHCSDDRMQAIHAQPHWHVYYPPPQYRGATFSEGSPATFSPDAQAADAVVEAKSMYFHFAMSAEWQRGRLNAHVGAITSATDLQHWLCGCLSYIASQLSST